MADYIYDKFKINNSIILSNVEINVFSSMYMPLIGIDSFSLYMFLITLVKDEQYSFKKLLDNLNIPSLKILNQSLDKLEALNLIKTYYHETKSYALEIIAPLSKEEFLDNEMLSQFLKTQIGEAEMARFYKKTETRLSGYKNISKKFSDVFQASNETVDAVIPKLLKPNIIVENPNFNYTLFKFLVDESLVTEAVLDDSKFQQRIERISFTYKLDEEEMRDIILKTINIDKNFEYSSIARNASLAFQKKHQVAGPAIETIKEDNFVLSVLDDNTQKLISLVESLSVSDILESLWNVKPSVSEIKMFDNLSQQTKLPISVINILILYVRQTKDQMPSYNYYEKIAVNWARAKVNSAYDAINHISSKKTQQTKTKFSQQKKVTKLPDWYEDYQKTLKQKPEEAPAVVVSNSKELLDLVKEMFD